MSVGGVPLIDISSLLDDEHALRELEDACANWGFFQITGHGVEQRLLDAVLEQMHIFFGQSQSEKQRIERTETNVWGFYDRELTKNVRDWKEILDVGPMQTDGPLAGSVPQWPDSLPGFKATMLEFMDACRAVSFTLLRGISRNLGMANDYLEHAFEQGESSFLRLNFYPVCDDPAPADSPTRPLAGHLGINHHTDAGALTVLLQDSQPGLQVYRAGAWHLVEPRSGALVINIGDIVQVWSNDRYEAPLHRVIASGSTPRYSAPYFFNPAYNCDYAPLPSLCDARHPPHYRPINWGEFRARRAAGDYADYGEEIQISQFRT